MSEVSNLMQAVRRKIEGDYVKRAGIALEEYANFVAADAQNLAPIRKMYSNRDKGARRASFSVPENEQFERMQRMAARTHWRDRTGRMQPGYVSPNVRIKNTSRRPRDIRNSPGSRARVLGTVIITTTKVPTGAEVKSIFGNLYWRGSTKSNRKVAHLAQEPWRKIQTASFRPAKGMDVQVGVRQTARPTTTGGWLIGKVKAGKSLLNELQSDQKYDLLSGRGLRLVPVKTSSGGAVSRYKVVLGGALRDSIVAEKVNQLEWQVNAHIRYAKYVEFGTRYMDAQPFMDPTMRNAKKEMADIIASKMNG
jgi:HK97 gp10 family phage protein